MRRTAMRTMAALLLGAARVAHAQHAGDMLLGSTAPGGGALALQYDFAGEVRVSESFTGGGSTLYTATDPGWDTLTAAGGGLFPLAAGTPVTVTLTARDPGVSLKVGAATLDAAGESASLGAIPIHLHPVWQLLVPTGTLGRFTLSFELTTTAPAYARSPVYTAAISNVVALPSSSTSTSTSTSHTIATISTTTATATVPSTSTSSTSTSTLPPAGDEPRSGKLLLLARRPGAPARAEMRAISKDAGLTLGDGHRSGDDPTLAGGSLRVRSASAGFDAVHPLPARGWTLIGKPGQGKGYRYRDRKLADGPVRVVVVKPRKLLQVTGKGAGLGHRLDADPRPVDVVLTLGAHRYCLRFGGDATFKPVERFRAKDAPAPGACPP